MGLLRPENLLCLAQIRYHDGNTCYTRRGGRGRHGPVTKRDLEPLLFPGFLIVTSWRRARTKKAARGSVSSPDTSLLSMTRHQPRLPNVERLESSPSTFRLLKLAKVAVTLPQECRIPALQIRGQKKGRAKHLSSEQSAASARGELETMYGRAMRKMTGGPRYHSSSRNRGGIRDRSTGNTKYGTTNTVITKRPAAEVVTHSPEWIVNALYCAQQTGRHQVIILTDVPPEMKAAITATMQNRSHPSQRRSKPVGTQVLW